MLKTVAIILSLFSIWAEQPLQTDELLSGIYIIAPPQKKMPCGNEAKMIIRNQKICISKKPIVAANQLTYATDIQYDPQFQMHYIDIGISTAGSHTLAQTMESLPDAQFALALENHVICVFKVSTTYAIHSFRIGGDVQLKDLTTIHEVLKNVKFK